MDYLLLNTFLQVARCGSFSKAADAMNCVQSNVTARIKRLELYFDQVLFERGRGGARLTEFGRQLESQATELMRAHEKAEQELLDAAGKSAKLKLGSMETTAGARLPKVLKWLSSQAPEAELSLQTGTTGELTLKVWEREIDAAFVAGPVDEKRFHCIPVFAEKLVLARPTKGQEALVFMAFRNSCSYRNISNQWLRMSGKSDTKTIEMGTLDGILGCVEAGMGFAIFAESAINTYREFDNITVEQLPAEIANTTTYLIWRYDHKPSQTHQKLMHYFSELSCEKEK